MEPILQLPRMKNEQSSFFLLIVDAEVDALGFELGSSEIFNLQALAAFLSLIQASMASEESNDSGNDDDALFGSGSEAFC